MTATTKKFVSFAIKAVILALAFYFIIHQYVNKGSNLKQFQLLVSNIPQQRVITIMAIVVVLMAANWGLEALKWKYLTRNLTNITPWQAIEGVFCGLTWAVITPNRFGEYGGRVMYLPPRRRIHGVFAMGVGAFGQLVITNVLGFIAIAWFTYTFLKLNTLVQNSVFFFACTSIAFFLILFFNIRWMVWLLDRIPFLKKFHRFFEIMGRYSFAELVTIMYFCLGRFFIFSLQYYLVIHLLVPQIPMYEVFLMVFIVLFIQSALPSLDVFDVAIRTYTATTLFAYVTTQEMAIAGAFASIWLINLIFPAIIGTIFTLNIKFFDRNA
ncbi:hypothetical protein [Mucilaginibacter auburnensis]|uniref:Lysylphosphatidylglycerol synthase-like protein n=1 Tax=Mucilaginibacter auburnensis TaxID=1457233 RepID=A0A2H9VQE2_9SPHI|nr:hypothetical protein [Mucilaginibacter auburnensis]PJJ80532.1 hypothetical protein CLV57_3683 [Mucilaginibacter auburnensis]